MAYAVRGPASSQVPGPSKERRRHLMYSSYLYLCLKRNRLEEANSLLFEARLFALYVLPRRFKAASMAEMMASTQGTIIPKLSPSGPLCPIKRVTTIERVLVPTQKNARNCNALLNPACIQKYQAHPICCM